MTKAEYIERYGIEGYELLMEQHKLYCREYRKKPEVKNHHKEYMKDYNKKPEFKNYQNEYRMNDLNSNGKTKSNIRAQSHYILFEQRKHTNIKGYEIHHAFGYDDPCKFIYIPKSLHIKIHKYLRDNNIDADINHYEHIKYLINECEEYTYISV